MVIKKRVCNLLLLGCVLILGCALSSSCSGNAKSVDVVDHSLELHYPCSEISQARLVLMHAPSEELFLGVLHPYAGLFEHYMDYSLMNREHAAYRTQLEACGVKTILVRDILLKDCIDENGETIQGEALDHLRELAGRFLVYNTDSLPQAIAEKQEAYRREILRNARPADLVSIIMLQPTIKLTTTANNTGLAALYEQNPIMNLYFTRDQMITTAKGTIIGRMNSPQREKECDVIEFCLNKMGIQPLYRVEGEESYLEGGDFYMFEHAAYIGCGMRTTQQAIDRLLEKDLFGADTVIVVKDHLFSQAQMHLDTYFNVIDKNLITLSESRITRDPQNPNYLTMDMYVKSDGNYRKAKENGCFLDYLTEHNYDIIAIGSDDANRLAGNFLTVKARHIFMVSGQSESMKKKLADKGVKVEWIALDELKKGYGAAHCMTQVVSRRD